MPTLLLEENGGRGGPTNQFQHTKTFPLIVTAIYLNQFGSIRTEAGDGKAVESFGLKMETRPSRGAMPWSQKDR